jgi:hypothetical protein
MKPDIHVRDEQSCRSMCPSRRAEITGMLLTARFSRRLPTLKNADASTLNNTP